MGGFSITFNNLPSYLIPLCDIRNKLWLMSTLLNVNHLIEKTWEFLD